MYSVEGVKCRILSFTEYYFLAPLIAPLQSPSKRTCSPSAKATKRAFLAFSFQSGHFGIPPDRFLPHLRASHAQETGVSRTWSRGRGQAEKMTVFYQSPALQGSCQLLPRGLISTQSVLSEKLGLI